MPTGEVITSDSGTDASIDAGIDASTDAGIDAGPIDAGEDAGTPDAGDAGPVLTLGPAMIPVATELSPYSIQLTTSGVVGTAHFGLDAGTANISLSTGGLLTSPATIAGNFPIQISVQDDATPTPQRVVNDYLFVVRPLLRVATPTQMNGAIAGDSYNEPLQATGGAGPYTWRVPDGGLPSWATINASNNVTGSAASGTFNFTLEVTDSSQPTPQIATRRTQISVLALGVCLSPTFLTPMLPDGRVGTPYTYTLRACGLGSPNWSKDGGAGFVLTNQPPTALITATPTDAGDFSFSTTATATLSATRGYTVHIDP